MDALALAITAVLACADAAGVDIETVIRILLRNAKSDASAARQEE
jgi:hypothetical protein